MFKISKVVVSARIIWGIEKVNSNNFTKHIQTSAAREQDKNIGHSVIRLKIS